MRSIATARTSFSTRFFECFRVRVLEVAVEGEVVADEDAVADRDAERERFVVRVPQANRHAHAVLLHVEREDAEHPHAVRRDRVLVLDDVQLPEAQRLDDGADERRMRDRPVRIGRFRGREQDEILPADELRAAVGDETNDRPVGWNHFNFCHESWSFPGVAALRFGSECHAAAFVAVPGAVCLPAMAALRRGALLFRGEATALARGAWAVRLLFRDDVDALQVRAVAHDDYMGKHRGPPR